MAAGVKDKVSVGTSVASDERREGKGRKQDPPHPSWALTYSTGWWVRFLLLLLLFRSSHSLRSWAAKGPKARPQVDRQVRKGKGTVPFYPPSEAWKTGQSPQASINDGGKGTVTSFLAGQPSTEKTQ